jgi:hypothetical protein
MRRSCKIEERVLRKKITAARAFLFGSLLICTPPAAAQQQDRCRDPGLLELVSSALTINLACDQVSPETKAERERVVTELMSEFRECFAQFQNLNAEIRSGAKLAAETIRRAPQPPESTTCVDFRARVERARKAAGH